MFVMTDAPEFAQKATGQYPGGDGETFTLDARFVALGETEQNGFDLNSTTGTVDFLRRTFVGMSDVLDADRQPVPFNETTRDWLIDRPYTRAALVKAYFAGVYGAQLGN